MTAIRLARRGHGARGPTRAMVGAGMPEALRLGAGFRVPSDAPPRCFPRRPHNAASGRCFLGPRLLPNRETILREQPFGWDADSAEPADVASVRGTTGSSGGHRHELALPSSPLVEVPDTDR